MHQSHPSQSQRGIRLPSTNRTKYFCVKSTAAGRKSRNSEIFATNAKRRPGVRQLLKYHRHLMQHLRTQMLQDRFQAQHRGQSDQHHRGVQHPNQLTWNVAHRSAGDLLPIRAHVETRDLVLHFFVGTVLLNKKIS